MAVSESSALPSNFPLLFGQGVRDRVLLVLNANGPLGTSQLVDCLICDEKKVRRALASFERMGILSKRGMINHRKYWTLDRRFLAYDELKELLDRLARLWEPPRIAVPAKRFGGANFRLRPDADPTVGELFGSVTRTRVMTAVAVNDCLNVQAIADSAGARYESVSYCVQSLQKKGVFRAQRRGRDLLVSLDDRFVAHPELSLLLKKLGRMATL